MLTLSELVKFCRCKLEEVGAESGKTNATRLKERVIKAVPNLTAHPEGREVILVLRHDIGGILTEAKRRDSDAWCLARGDRIVRKDILKVANSFNGKFSPECQKNPISASLLSLVCLSRVPPPRLSAQIIRRECLSHNLLCLTE